MNDRTQPEGYPMQDAQNPSQVKAEDSATHRAIIHLQVSGNPSAERLQQVAQLFQQASLDPLGAVIATPQDVIVFSLQIPKDVEPPISVSGCISPELIAQLTYEVNRVYSQSLGDNSFPSWVDASEHQKSVNRRGVQTHLRNPSLTPKQSHENWMLSKTEAGYVYGETKDDVAKTHPSMLPYAALTPQVKAKDVFFKTIVDTLRSLLPQVSQYTRQVEIFVPQTNQWVVCEFTDLQEGYIWRFSDQADKIYRAITAPYPNFGEYATTWNIDAESLALIHPEDVEVVEDVSDTNVEGTPIQDMQVAQAEAAKESDGELNDQAGEVVQLQAYSSEQAEHDEQGTDMSGYTDVPAAAEEDRRDANSPGDPSGS